MSRMKTIPQAEASGQAAELFAGIKRSLGKVPNAYLAIGSQSPTALAAQLQTDATIKSGVLSAREIEAINLVVSQTSGCDYCLAAHTLMARGAGFTVEQTHQLRAGRNDDAKIGALVTFIKNLLDTRGAVAEGELAAVHAAGYDDPQIVEALLAVSAISFTNLFNRVNDTAIDFPKVAELDAQHAG